MGELNILEEVKKAEILNASLASANMNLNAGIKKLEASVKGLEKQEIGMKDVVFELETKQSILSDDIKFLSEEKNKIEDNIKGGKEAFQKQEFHNDKTIDDLNTKINSLTNQGAKLKSDVSESRQNKNSLDSVLNSLKFSIASNEKFFSYIKNKKTEKSNEFKIEKRKLDNNISQLEEKESSLKEDISLSEKKLEALQSDFDNKEKKLASDLKAIKLDCEQKEEAIAIKEKALDEKIAKEKVLSDANEKKQNEIDSQIEGLHDAENELKLKEIKVQELIRRNNIEK